MSEIGRIGFDAADVRDSGNGFRDQVNVGATVRWWGQHILQIGTRGGASPPPRRFVAGLGLGVQVKRGAWLRLEVLGGLEDAAVLHLLAAPVSDGERGDRAGADAAERGGGRGGGGQVAHAVAVHGHGGSAAAPGLHPGRPLGARHEHRPKPLTNRLSVSNNTLP